MKHNNVTFENNSNDKCQKSYVYKTVEINLSNKTIKIIHNSCSISVVYLFLIWYNTRVEN